MTISEKYLFRFPNEELDIAGQDTEALQEALLDAIENINVVRVKESPNTQDLGATLAVILAGPALVALAKGIAKWMTLRGQHFEIEIEYPDGSRARVKATGQLRENEARMVEALAKKLEH